MTDTIMIYLATLLAFLVLDAVWLGFAVKRFYKAKLGTLLSPRPNFLVAAAFYMIYAAGIVHFVVMPAEAGDWTAAAINGAFLGLIAYGTYDMTNQATVEGWPWSVTVVDTAWGAILTGATAMAGLLIPPMIAAA